MTTSAWWTAVSGVAVFLHAFKSEADRKRKMTDLKNFIGV
jgi:hypothetical protein